MHKVINSFRLLKEYCENEGFKGWDPYDAPQKGVTLVTPFFVVYQAIKALEVDGEHIKIGCIFTGNLPVFPDFYRYFHL